MTLGYRVVTFYSGSMLEPLKHTAVPYLPCMYGIPYTGALVCAERMNRWCENSV